MLTRHWRGNGKGEIELEKDTPIKDKEKSLEDFLLHIDCLDELKPWLDNFNIFDVLKISRTEIRHSNMLSWLLNPYENHGLNDSFLRALIRGIIKNGTFGNAEPIELMTADLRGVQILREWEDIDILIYTEEFIIAIENKIDSSEHDNQLKKYREIIENKYKQQKKIYLYLTPLGVNSGNSNDWEIISYTDILDAVVSVFETKKMDLADGSKQLIKDYIHLLRSRIVEDPKLVEICRKIYLQYKPALDLIFENKGNPVSECIIEVLKEKNFLVNEAYSRNSMIVFSTKEMDSLLPILENKKEGAWSDGCSYHYWIGIISEEKLFGCFELGGWNLTENIKKNQAVIIENSSNKKARKNDEFQFKRVFTTKKLMIDSTEIKSVKNAALKIIEELMQNEKKLIELFPKKA